MVYRRFHRNIIQKSLLRALALPLKAIFSGILNARGSRICLGRVSFLSAKQAKINPRTVNSSYDGGCLVAAALDLQIRKQTQNRSSLDDVMQQMYREFGPTDDEFTMRDVIRIVSQIAGEDFKPFFNEYVAGTERLPLEAYFRDAGLDVEIAFGERLPSLRYILFQMLEIRSLGGPNRRRHVVSTIHRSIKMMTT